LRVGAAPGHRRDSRVAGEFGDQIGDRNALGVVSGRLWCGVAAVLAWGGVAAVLAWGGVAAVLAWGGVAAVLAWSGVLAVTHVPDSPPAQVDVASAPVRHATMVLDLIGTRVGTVGPQQGTDVTFPT